MMVEVVVQGHCFDCNFDFETDLLEVFLRRLRKKFALVGEVVERLDYILEQAEQV
jgi:hypothetical protein